MATTIKVDGTIISINAKSQEKYQSPSEIYMGAARGLQIGNAAATTIKAAAHGAGKMALKNLGVSVVQYLASLGLGTLLTSAVSCGTFKDGTGIFNSQKCKHKINAFKNKYNYKDVSVSDVKNDPKAKTKSGFWNWVFAGNASGKKVTKIPKHDVAVRQIDGVTVAVTTLDPFTGSVDLRQLAGQKILIVTGFYKKNNGSIGSKNLCRGYLSKGGTVNKSGESLTSGQEQYLSLESLMEPVIEDIKEKALESFFGLNDEE